MKYSDALMREYKNAFYSEDKIVQNTKVFESFARENIVDKRT